MLYVLDEKTGVYKLYENEEQLKNHNYQDTISINELCQKIVCFSNKVTGKSTQEYRTDSKTKKSIFVLSNLYFKMGVEIPIDHADKKEILRAIQVLQIKEKNANLKIKEKSISYKLGHISSKIIKKLLPYSLVLSAGIAGATIYYNKDNIKDYMKEREEQQEYFETQSRIAPVYNYLINTRNKLITTNNLTNDSIYNYANEKLREFAISTTDYLLKNYSSSELEEFISGQVLTNKGEKLVEKYLESKLNLNLYSTEVSQNNTDVEGAHISYRTK